MADKETKKRKVSPYFKRGNKIWIRPELMTDETREEVKELKSCGYTVHIVKKKEEKTVEEHKVDKDFNISYDEVRKADMIEYVKNFVEDRELSKKWARESHNFKDGKRSFAQIKAKKAFYKIFFPERWEKEIQPMLEKRQFKATTKKDEKDFFDELLG